MGKDILNYLQETHKGYIHPNGKAATDIIFKTLEPQKGEHILELGFGTGTSLITLLSRHPSINLYGVDINPAMYEKAEQRLKYCSLDDKIILKLLGKNKTIPFEANYFDKVYVESVLAIQKGDDLQSILEEIHRVLKPNGWLCFNELIWSDKTSQEEIDSINNFAVNNFGIIQANGKYPYLNNWLSLLKSINFEIVDVTELPASNNKNYNLPANYQELLSSYFSLKGKIKGKLNSKLRKDGKEGLEKMKTLDMQNKVEAYIVKATCNK